MLTTGNQMKAARVMVDVDQVEVARLSGVSVATIRNMEARGASTIKSSLAIVRKVQEVLEAQGVEFQNHGRPGVRMKDAEVVEQIRLRKIEALEKEIADLESRYRAETVSANQRDMLILARSNLGMKLDQLKKRK